MNQFEDAGREIASRDWTQIRDRVTDAKATLDEHRDHVSEHTHHVLDFEDVDKELDDALAVFDEVRKNRSANGDTLSVTKDKQGNKSPSPRPSGNGKSTDYEVEF